MRLPRDSWRYRLYLAVAGFSGALFLRVLGATWRVRTLGEDPFASGQPLVATTWHRGLLVAAYCWRDRGIVVPVSQSRDGDLIDAVLRRLGFASSARGSSSRGASTLLRSLIRRVRDGASVGFLPDGPRGPAGTAKPGVIALARASGAPLVPIGISAAPRKQFGSWDRAILPLPFARVVCRYGTPIHVPKKTSGEALEQLRGELEATLDRMNQTLDQALGSAAASGPNR
jgi:lysophospholipid acyltransferase (LPLAT)-like uncharacterized protein